jgi:hypothetical protein
VLLRQGVRLSHADARLGDADVHLGGVSGTGNGDVVRLEVGFERPSLFQ